MIEDDEDYLNFSDADMVGSPPEPGFSGLRLFIGPDGDLAMWLFREGRIIELEPNESDHSRPLGFYDYNWNPVPDPAG